MDELNSKGCEKISVIIAAYNAERHIGDCLDSILNQTYKNIEVWVCDDASTDNTLAILQKYAAEDKRIHVLHNSKNMYAGFSRNRCLEKCSGEYIAIQDADDVANPQRFEHLIRTIRNSKCDFVSSGHYLFDDNGIYKESVPQIETPQIKDFLYGIPFCHAATLFSKECLLDVNGYRVSKETRRGQDYDMFMRLYAKGYTGKNIKNILYGYRVDRDTISRRRFRYRIDECVIRYKGFKNLGLLPGGFLYIFKPIPAFFVQALRRR